MRGGMNRMNTGDSAGFVSPPNRPDGLEISRLRLRQPALNIQDKLYAALGVVVGREEGLKYFVGQQSSPRSQPNTIPFLLDQFMAN